MPRLNITRRHSTNGRTTNGRNGTTSQVDLNVNEKALLGTISSYLESLANTKRPAEFRARDPLANHPWVFAAAMAISRTAGQAPFTVFRKQREPGQRLRAGRNRRNLYDWVNLTGVQRMWKLAHSKDLGVEIEHPISTLLRDPNPYQQGSQLMQLTLLWLAIRGECFWVMTDDDGNPADVLGSSKPTRLWPVGPDAFEAIYENEQTGQVIGWAFTPPSWMPGVTVAQKKIPLGLENVVQFKTPNPSDPTRGLSPITAVAQGIQTDLKAKTYNERVLDNQGKPDGVLSTERMLKKAERDEILGYWKDRHEGPENAARVAMLFGGLKWTQIALSPQDLEFLKTFEWDREEILAVIGTPPSVLGLPNKLNYATQLGQDKNFWDKTVLPYFRLIETTIDKALFFTSSDDIFGMFDVSNVEAMRAGIAEKIAMADKMCGNNLHTPPKVAYEVVGLEVPEYKGDDIAMVGAMSVPLDFALEPEPEPPPAPAPAKIKAKGGKRWRQFIKVQRPLERKYIKAYRSWATEEEKGTLKRLDAQSVKAHTKEFNLAFVLPNLFRGAKSLKSKIQPISFASAEASHKFNQFEIPTFELDKNLLNDAVKRRMKIAIKSVPKTIQEKLRKSLVKGLEKGETLSQLRRRVMKIYSNVKSSAHATTIARTETGGIMNDVRFHEFKQAGIKKVEWSTAGDENVRSDHVVFGASGSHKIGYNFGSLASGAGTLEFPLDSRGSAAQTINCRCILITTTG